MVPGEPSGARHELCGARNTTSRRRRDGQERRLLRLRFGRNGSAAMMKPPGRWPLAAPAGARWRDDENGQGVRVRLARALMLSADALCRFQPWAGLERNGSRAPPAPQRLERDTALGVSGRGFVQRRCCRDVPGRGDVEKGRPYLPLWLCLPLARTGTFACSAVTAEGDGKHRQRGESFGKRRSRNQRAARHDRRCGEFRWWWE